MQKLLQKITKLVCKKQNKIGVVLLEGCWKVARKLGENDWWF